MRKRRYIIEVRRLFLNGKSGKWQKYSELITTAKWIKEHIKDSNRYNNNLHEKNKFCKNYEFRSRSQKDL